MFLNDLSAASVSSPIETKGAALTTGIYTVSAAAISNGVLGNISSYRFAVCPQVTDIKWGSTSTADDHALATLNGIFISFTKPTSDTRFTYALYSTTGTTSPGGWNTTDPTGVTFTASTTESFFNPTLSTPGLKNFFVSTLFDNRPAGTYFLSAGSPLVSFTYDKNESLLSGTSAGNEGKFTFTGGTNAKTLMYARITSGMGGACLPAGGGGVQLGGFGFTFFTIGGWRGLVNNDIITVVPAANGVNAIGTNGSSGGAGGAGKFKGGNGGNGNAQGPGTLVAAPGGGGGGGSAYFAITRDGTTYLTILSGGGGGGGQGDGNYVAGGGGGGGGGYTGPGGDAEQFVPGNGGAGGGSTRGGGDGGQGSIRGIWGATPGSNAQYNSLSVFLDSIFTTTQATNGARAEISLYWVAAT